ARDERERGQHERPGEAARAPSRQAVSKHGGEESEGLRDDDAADAEPRLPLDGAAGGDDVGGGVPAPPDERGGGEGEEQEDGEPALTDRGSRVGAAQAPEVVEREGREVGEGRGDEDGVVPVIVDAPRGGEAERDAAR